MKKFRVLVCFILLIFMVGCGGAKTHKTFSYNVDNGDRVTVKLDTTGGYDMTAELPFKISLDNQVFSQASFIQAEYYEQYVEAVETDEAAVVLESGEKDGNTYVFWEYNEKEYNYVIMISDSKTAVLLANNVSKESAQECFNRLTFYVE